MTYDNFKALRDTIRAETLSRQQVAQLLGDVVVRVVMIDEPELRPVQQSLANACEELEAALTKVEYREAA